MKWFGTQPSHYELVVPDAKVGWKHGGTVKKTASSSLELHKWAKQHGISKYEVRAVYKG